MGTENHRLEMLFLAPSERGKGLGRQLLEYGIRIYDIQEVTVNEQNPQAVGFYEYMGFDNYQIEVLTTDNGYETLEIMLGYEDAMVFDYYLINGDKMAFISASTYSNDENLYDSLEEYTKEVVNSFKWNE